MFEKVFTELGLNESAQSIYGYLLEYGASSARRLAENLGIPRPSIYDNIKILIQKGLVTERIQDNKKIFQIDDVKNIPHLISTKISLLEKEKKTIESLLPTLAHNMSSIEPKIKFFSGIEGVRHLLDDVLWYENIETLTMWPISEMIEVLGSDYFDEFNRHRIRKNIYFRALWPKNRTVSLKDYPSLGVGKKFLREIRVAPKEMTWDMGYMNYGDKVAFISSRKEAFGFIIHSKDFSQLLKTQFEVIWKASKPIPEQRQYTDAYLKTV